MRLKQNASRWVAYAVLSLTLMGCSSSGGDDPEQAQASGEGSPATGLSLAASSTSSPAITLAECGSVPPSDVSFSSVAATPSPMLPGSIFEGLVDPDSATNQANFWSIDLEPGTYGVFVDSNTLDGDSSNIGLSVIASVPDEDAVQIVRSNEIDQRMRAFSLIDVNRASTITFQIEPRFGAEDYSVAVFENGAAVPSPYFSDCPSIADFPLGDSRVFALQPQIADAVNDVWFRVDLPVNLDQYELSATASYLDGESRNLIYDAILYDQYGQTDRQQTVIHTNEIEVSFATSGQIEITEPGVRWLRFINTRSTALQVESTLY